MSPRLDTPPGSPLALSAMRMGPSHGLTDRQGEEVPGMSAGQMHRCVCKTAFEGGFPRATHSLNQKRYSAQCQVLYEFFKEGTALKFKDCVI